MKVLGYSISAPDNDSYMNEDMWGKDICDCLDFVKNRQAHLNTDFKLTKKNYDISYTYDAYLIVSDRFKQFCVDNKNGDILFYRLPNDEAKFLMTVNSIVKFDTKRRGTKFLNFNSKCNEYNEVIGATPVCLANNLTLPDGFFRTDMEFGGSYAKSPVILLGFDTYTKLKAQKFKGLYCKKILDKYEWENKSD